MKKQKLRIHLYFVQLAKLRANQRGAIVIMMALMLPLLLGFTGLGVEVGSWFQNKRDIQTIADAAAVSGAYSAQSSSATSASILADTTTDATLNGYSATTDTITSSNPPTSGSYTTDVGAVEVNITRSVSLLFSSTFLNNNVSITARAVARTGESDDTACVLSLDTSGAGVSVTGSGDVTFSGCEVASNSTEPTALTVAGAGDLTTDCYTVAGSISVASNSLHTDADCEGKTEAPTILDPYSGLTAPSYTDPTDCDEASGYSYNTNGGSDTLVHDADFSVPYIICGDFNVNNGNVTLEPGLYIIAGNFSAGANAVVSGDGVTIILMDGGQLTNINGGATINLSAPDALDAVDDWEGVLFFQDPLTADVCTGNNCNTINGGANSTFEGVMYFPDQEIQMSGGNTSTSKCLQIVGLRVSFTGSSAMNASNAGCSDAGVTGIALPGDVELVE